VHFDRLDGGAVSGLTRIVTWNIKTGECELGIGSHFPILLFEMAARRSAEAAFSSNLSKCKFAPCA